MRQNFQTTRQTKTIKMRKNKPDQATMRPGCVSICIDHVTYMERQMDEQTGRKGSQNMLVDHLFQFRISPWLKTAEKRGFCAGVTDRRTDSDRDAFLTDASKNLSNIRQLNNLSMELFFYLRWGFRRVENISEVVVRWRRPQIVGG